MNRFFQFLFIALFAFATTLCINAQEPNINVERNPIVGEKKGLALRIQFAGSSFASTFTDATFETFLNGDFWNTGTTQNSCSIKNYYQRASHQKLTLTHEIAPVVTLAKSKETYLAEDATTYTIVNDAIEALKVQHPDYLASLDLASFYYDPKAQLHKTNEGIASYVKSMICVTVIYSGEAPAGTPTGGTFYPHMGFFPNKCITLGDVDGAPAGLHFYQIIPEKHEGAEGLKLGMVAHEIGHALGFVDFYDPSNYTSGLGRHCMMSYPLNTTPQPFNPFIQWQAGWIEFKELPTTETELTLTPADTFRYVRVNPTNRKEFFIIEPRHRTSTDITSNLPATGLAIWHVDMSMNFNRGSQSYVPTTSNHYMLSLEQANGLFQLEAPDYYSKYYGSESDYFGSGSYSTFSNATTPNSKYWSDLPSGLKLENIQYNAVTGAVSLISRNPYVATDFSIAEMQYSDTEVKEGGFPIELNVFYTGAKAGDVLEFTPPTTQLVAGANETLSRTLAEGYGNVSFALQSVACNGIRNSSTTLTKANFSLNGNPITDSILTRPLKFIENDPPLTITAVPEVNIVSSINQNFNLRISIRNALTSYFEDYFSTHTNSPLALNSTISNSSANYDGTSTARVRNFANGNKITSLLLKYGSNASYNGVYVPETQYTVPLSRPIFCSDNANQSFIAMHAAKEKTRFEQEICTVIFTVYNAKSGRILPAPDFGSRFQRIGAESYTFTSDSSYAEISFSYIALPNGDSTGYTSPGATLAFNDGVSATTYTLDAGLFTIRNNEPGDTKFPTQITLAISPDYAHVEWGETFTFTPSLTSLSEEPLPKDASVRAFLIKENNLADSVAVASPWTPDTVGNYELFFEYPGNVAFAPSTYAHKISITQNLEIGSPANPYKITNEAELIAFAQRVNAGDSALCARIQSDITVTQNAQFPMTNYAGIFSGETDANLIPRHTITFNIANRTGTNASFIANAIGAQIENLNFEFKGPAQNYTRQSSSLYGCAAFIGQVKEGLTLQNIRLTLSATLQNESASDMAISPLLGFTDGNMDLKNVHVQVTNGGTIYGVCPANGNIHIGGFAGRFNTGIVNITNGSFLMDSSTMFTTNTLTASYPNYRVGGLGFREGGATININHFYAEIGGTLTCGSVQNATSYASKFNISGLLVSDPGGTLKNIVVKMLSTGKISASTATESLRTRAYGILPKTATAENVWYVRPAAVSGSIPAYPLSGTESTYYPYAITQNTHARVYILDESRVNTLNVGDSIALIQNSNLTSTLNTVPESVAVSVQTGSNCAQFLTENAKLKATANATAQKISLRFTKVGMPEFSANYILTATGGIVDDSPLPVLYTPEEGQEKTDGVLLRFANPEEKSYKILRSESRVGPWTPIIENITDSEYNDTATVPGKTYYYILSR